MPKGMFVDTSICIGCKACQVACKEWNELEGEPDDFAEVNGRLKAINFTGHSYDNTGRLTATNWRHVRFIERGSSLEGTMAWYMMSDSCKHCAQAGCLEVCPTHALMRTDLGNVVVQQDVCNGCRACIGACPTDSIVFGDVDQLRVQARQRVETLKALGHTKAQLYGDTDVLGGLNVFYLLLDDPEVYDQPKSPQLPQRNLIPGSLWSIGTAIVLGLTALAAFRDRGTRSAVRKE